MQQFGFGYFSMISSFKTCLGQGGLLHLRANVKIDYIVLNAKLLLINMNNVNFFLFLEIL